MLFLLLACLSVYQEIPDIQHPRMCDWVQIQKFLAKGERKELRLLDQAIDEGGILADYRCRLRRMRLIGKHFWNRPQFKREILGGASPEEKDLCIITYATFNKHYPESIQGLKKQLENTGFRGHFLYRIGGWPNLEGGSLVLAHVPYAFKVCFFQEAKRLGYRRVLWLDSSIRPVQSLDSVFHTISKRGYLWYPSGTKLAAYCNREVMEWFGYAPEKAREIDSVAAGLVGLSFEHSMGNLILDRWMEAAKAETPFYSPRCDQNALSLIAHKEGLREWEPISALSWDRGAIGDQTVFLIDYRSVQ